MVYALALALTLGFQTQANELHALPSSYCAAVLENQWVARSASDAEVSKNLKLVAARAEDLSRGLKLPGSAGIDDLYVNLEVPRLSGGDARAPLGASELKSLARIPKRLTNLFSNLTRERGTVSSSGLILRGKDEILPYLTRLRDVTIRNEFELAPAVNKMFPYVRASRVLAHGIGAGAFASGLYWLGHHVDLNALLDTPTWTQGAWFAGTVGASYVAGRILAILSLPYVRGMFSPSARVAFENTRGLRSHRSSFERLDALIDLTTRAEAYPDALVYLTDEHAFDAEDVRELNAAARDKRAPSAEFVRRHLDGGAVVPASLGGPPFSSILKLDLIYAYDKVGGEPVLMTFDRFVKDDSPPPTPSYSRRRTFDRYGVGSFRPSSY